jgi:hypothetical protein
MGPASKWRNVYQGHIPRAYGGSATRYLLGIPSLEAADQAHDIGEIMDMKNRMKRRR